MEWITYSWLACCATAPSVAAIAVWVLFIFHTYRRRWRTVDIFLLTIALQEIPSTLCAFGYAVVTVIRTRSESSCNFVIWGLTTIRVFQMTTLTSLAFDRALTLKWPYKYRFSVRHSQVRYHIVVLGVISTLVGVAGLFARLQLHDIRDQIVPHSNSNVIITNATMNYYCSLNPYSWDYRYNVFISSLYSFLTFVTFTCALYIEINRYRGNTRPNSRISSVGNLVIDHSGSTEAIGRSESYRTLYGFQANSKHGSINKKTLEDQRAFDLRWSTVIGSIGLCYAVNHGTSLAFTIVSLMVPFWNPLHDNISVWLSIAEGLLLPITLYITDDPFRDAVKRSFRRRNHRCSDVSKSTDGPFPLYFNDFAMVDKKPYLMSSIPAAATGSALTLVSNYRRSLKGNSKLNRCAVNDLLMKPSNGCLSSLRKCKLPKNNDRYMFLSIYGVDKVIPVNKQSGSVSNDQNVINTQSSVNPYYKNCTTISTFAGSDNSIRKENIETLQRQSSIEKAFPWYQIGNPLGHPIQDVSWQSHHLPNVIVNDIKDKKHQIDEHIYATLSETFSVRSTLPHDKREPKEPKMERPASGNDHNSLSIQKSSNRKGAASVDGFSMSGVSFTTTANDDFEYTRGTDACSNGMLDTDNHNHINNNDARDNNDNNNDVSSVSSCPYSSDDSAPKGHIYDNLAFEFENVNGSSIVAQSHSLEPLSEHPQQQSLIPQVSAMNYHHRRYSPFVPKTSNNNNAVHYKRRGRQSFSASDLHKLESPIYSLQTNGLIYERRSKNCRGESVRIPSIVSSSPRKTLSETNLLQTAKCKSGSLTKITEDAGQQSSGDLDEFSDDSINSTTYSTTSSSWDIHNKLAEVLKKKTGQNSVVLRQNGYASRGKSRIRTKRNKLKRKRQKERSLYHNQSQSDVNQQTPQPNHGTNNQGNLCSQSVWSIESNRPVIKLSGITRIGSYAHEWCVNKSMPDLSSLTICPSPVFSPLYRKGAKSKGLRSPHD